MLPSPTTTTPATAAERPSATGHATSTSWPPIVLPLVGLALITALLAVWRVDLRVADACYDRAARTWPSRFVEPWRTIDRIGSVLGVTMGLAGFAVALLSRRLPRLRRWRRAGRFLFLCLALGPGLLVNGVLKTSWGRPRPMQLVEFGGDSHYLPVWTIGSDREFCRSFPSGHASIGFLLIAPAFCFYRTRRGLFLALLAAGLAWGTLMSVSRIVQGSHFVTDVLWSAGLVYVTSALLARVVKPDVSLGG